MATSRSASTFFLAPDEHSCHILDMTTSGHAGLTRLSEIADKVEAKHIPIFFLEALAPRACGVTETDLHQLILSHRGF